MGNSQGARKISISNDKYDAGVIKISEDLANRLSGAIEQAPPPQVIERPIDNFQNVNSQTYVVQPPSLTALSILQEKEQQLKKNDAYWRQRLHDMEEKYKRLDNIQEIEFNKAVENVKSSFKQLPPAYQLPPCEDVKSQVIDCYKANPKTTLKCESIVQNFIQCVDQKRSSLISQKS